MAENGRSTLQRAQSRFQGIDVRYANALRRIVSPSITSQDAAGEALASLPDKDAMMALCEAAQARFSTCRPHSAEMGRKSYIQREFTGANL